MKKIFSFAFVLFMFLLLLCADARAQVKSVPLDVFYMYDKKLPLKSEVKKVQDTAAFLLEEITFDSVNDARVTASLFTPKSGKKPYPVMIFMHGIGMKRDVPEQAAPVIMGAGYAVFSISAKYTNDRKVNGKELSSMGAGTMIEFRNALVQSIVDYRRGLDYLETRPEIDTKRMGILGLSLGAVMGNTLFAVEPRIRMAAFMVGGGNFEVMAEKSVFFGPNFETLGLGMTKEQILTALSPVDPFNFSKHSKGRPKLMINGRNDEIVPPKSSAVMYDALLEPKHIVWYEGGHVPSMNIIMRLVRNVMDWYKLFLLPEKLPLVENNHWPVVKNISLGKTETVVQGETFNIDVQAEDADKNICFVKVYNEGDDTEEILFDDGRKGYDKKAGDGIFGGKMNVTYGSKIGTAKLVAIAVDYNGDKSRELTAFVDIKAYPVPEGAHAPEIVKVDAPKEIKIGTTAVIKVEAKDADDDIDAVEVTLVEFGISMDLQREGNSNVFSYSLEIPSLDMVQTGTYHIAVRAKDKARLKSKREEVAVQVVK